jgi:hypothetical protein
MRARQLVSCIRLAQLARFSHDAGRHPARIRHESKFVLTLFRVNLLHGSQVLRFEKSRNPDQRRPQAAMHICDFPAHEPADQDVVRIANSSGEPEDLFPFRVAPPASLYAAPRHHLGEIRNWSARTLEDDAMAADKRESRSWCHSTLVTSKVSEGAGRKRRERLGDRISLQDKRSQFLYDKAARLPSAPAEGAPQ